MSGVNDYMVLVAGPSGTGKSASLENLRDHPGVLYLNCEAGKKLPFRNNFSDVVISDPYQITDMFDYMMANNYTIPHPRNGDVTIHTVVIDTLTFLLDMYESKYVFGAANGQQAWANFAQFFKMLMQDKIAQAKVNVVILAHTLEVYNETAMTFDIKVPVKGSLKNNGIEAYFSTVVSTKKIPLAKLEGFKSDLLHITEDDEIVGYKHVFQTRLTKETTGERIRSPMRMFTQAQTYMDNDVQLLLDHLHSYYQQ